jgi:hypothetical protein
LDTDPDRTNSNVHSDVNTNVYGNTNLDANIHRECNSYGHTDGDKNTYGDSSSADSDQHASAGGYAIINTSSRKTVLGVKGYVSRG